MVEMRKTVSQKEVKAQGLNQLHKFYFVKPMPDIDARALADMLGSLSGIEKAYVSDCDKGFVVKARFRKSIKENFSEYLAKSLNRKFKMALSYYSTGR